MSTTKTAIDPETVHSAITTWSGFVYQGKLALYHILTLLAADRGSDNCFLQLDSLEDKVKEILQSRSIPYIHHVTSLTPFNGKSVALEPEPGEIDFIIVDPNCKKILITDCKYHRARYEMVGFSSDFRNFRDNYEPKINRKVKYIKEKKQLLQEHLQREGKIDYDISGFECDALFIVNTPTFYILNGTVKTVTATHLENLIDNCYTIPDLVAKMPDEEKLINHPFFRKK